MRLTLEIIMFYGVAFTVLTYIFSRKTRLVLSLVISMLIVMVASEYWEIPIFIFGFFGWWGNFPYPSLPFILHHLNTIMLFIWLIYIAKIKISRGLTLFLLTGIVVNTILIFGFPNNHLWVPRFIGIYILA